MKRNTNSIWLLALIVITIVSTGRSAQAQQLFAQNDIDNLTQIVKDFTSVWYQEKNENKFWEFVAKNSIMKSNLGSNAFSGAFTGKPENADTSTLKISFQIYESVFKGESLVGKVTPPLNTYTTSGKWNIFPDGFAVFPGNDAVLGEIRGDFFGNPEDVEKAKNNGLVPRQNYLIVLYYVAGNGYTNEMMFTLWVKEGNKWKLFSFFGS